MADELENELTTEDEEVEIDLDTEITIKVDGEEKNVSIQHLIDQAQKGGAAEKRLEEASRVLKENQQKVQIGEALLKAKSGDIDSLRVAARAMGASDEEIDPWFTELQSYKAGGTQPTQGDAAPATVSKEAVAAALGVNPDELGRMMRFGKTLEAKGMDLEQVANVLGTGISQQGQNVLSSDLATHLVDKAGKKGYTLSEQSKSVLVDIALGDLHRRVRETKDGRTTPEMMRQVADKAIEHAEKLGALSSLPLPGLGSTEAAEITERYQSVNTKKRPDINSGEDFDNWIGKSVIEKTSD